MVLCACPDAEVADLLAQAAVVADAAACATRLEGATSVFRWQGEVQSATECLLLIKTRSACFEELAALIRARHPYEVPEIIALPITMADPAYLRWIDVETRLEE